ncbi:MAG: metallophosphoesterase [Flavobacterium sp.]|nr:metallophosphoesterase [Candidatus Neoflavobacterium equi]
MKLFVLESHATQRFFKLSVLVVTTSIMGSCATYKTRYGKDIVNPIEENKGKEAELIQQIFLVGDAGEPEFPLAKQNLSILKSDFSGVSKKSTLLFLGDNVYPKGLPKEGSPNRAEAEAKLDELIEMGKKFPGKTLFIAGNHDWYSGFDGVVAQNERVETLLGDKKSFFPKQGCGIDKIELTDQLVMITLDTQWYIENWDNHPHINDGCDIKTREDFFEEFNSLINKYQNKTIVVAMHHPLFSDGEHGGKISIKDHLLPYKNIPLPVIGTVGQYVRKTSGMINQDLQYKHYVTLVNRIKTAIQSKDNVVVVSGHDHNMQYIEREGVKQIISGSGSKKDPGRPTQPVSFTSGDVGYSVLDVYKSGETWITYYSTEKNGKEKLFSRKVLEAFPNYKFNFKRQYQATTGATVYPKEWTDKGKVYRFLWGEHYRKYYATSIQAPNLFMQKDFGGLKPLISGGGTQTMSLRLENGEGKEYSMRGIKKSAPKFVQKALFKEQAIEEDVKGTYAETFIYDFYTTSHPFTPFILDEFTSKLGILHTNPKLYYVPRQPALGNYNLEFGNELYMVEERPSKSQTAVKSFGNPQDIISTPDLMDNLKKDEKYQVDQKAYLKARLFDMLVGDWDRHGDQWRWSEFAKGDSITYQPIPRDRDQAFAKIDGAVLSLLKKIPPMRHMQSYKKKFAHPRWINKTAFPMDVKFLHRLSASDWEAQAREIKEIITDEVIDQAFLKLPKEVQDQTTEEVKDIMRYRRDHLQEYALKYYDRLQKTVVIAGTDKKDKFLMERLHDGNVSLSFYRIKKDSLELQFNRVYDAKITKEIWVYGLDDDDVFEVTGSKNTAIKLRMIGGLNKDTYTIANRKNVRIYDHESKKSNLDGGGTSNVFFNDKYDLNLYDYEKSPINILTVLPQLGYNPDDGLKLGLSANLKINNFNLNPFSQQHTLTGTYSFRTHGADFAYKGIFPNAGNNWRFQVDARFTSPNFAQNYFGFGNETVNNLKDRSNYYRVRMQTIQVQPSYKLHTYGGVVVGFALDAKSLKVSDTPDRFITQDVNIQERLFDEQQFLTPKFTFEFENYNLPAHPTLGFGFKFESGWTLNLDDTKRNFAYLNSSVNFNHPIDRREKLVFATMSKYKKIFNQNYDFFQGATLGGDQDLRGFRRERFVGDQSFLQSSDIRWNIGTIKRSIAPMQYGALVGYDLGRVWYKGEQSDKWYSSYGVGIWLSAMDTITGHVGYFSSQDGGRITGGFGFAF